MKILILGGGGFVGCRLATSLLSNKNPFAGPLKELILLDKEIFTGSFSDTRVSIIRGSITNDDLIQELLAKKPDIIYHLAAVVSGEAEKNFDLGMTVNLHATLSILETCRRLAFSPIFVFASSCAVFGGDVDQPIKEDTAPLPRSSYGTQKAIAELLVNDFSRRGYIDGRSLRLPTIAIRPGKANAATSSFISSIIREPLKGKSTNCPVPPSTLFWIQSPKVVIRNLIHAARIGAQDLSGNRIITLPGLTTSIQELVDALTILGGTSKSSLISWNPDSFLQGIVLTWPPHFEIKKAEELGFLKDESTLEIVKTYIDDENIQV